MQSLAATRRTSPAMSYSSKADQMMRRFGRNLASARVTAGYSNASDFAEALKIGDQRYRKYERGDAMPPPDILAEIRSLLGVSLDWLILNDAAAARRPTDSRAASETGADEGQSQE